MTGMRSETTGLAGSTAATEEQKLPRVALLALTTAAFITVMTEALPAGVLPAMSGDLRVSQSAMGQAVTVYALGTALTAIPLSVATAGWSRKRLLLSGVAGFAVANTVTAGSSDYAVTMASRFFAGVAAGVVWALLAGYAGRMAPKHLQGKAIALVMAGIPLALSLGIPAGTFLGSVLSWQATFWLMTAIAVVLLAWISTAVPDFAGQRPEAKITLWRTLALPGVCAVLFVTLAFVLGHNILYTYIATTLDPLGMGDAVDLVLLLFGVASMVSIWVVGACIHRWLRALSIASTILVAVGATMLAVSGDGETLVYWAAIVWGLGWGGVPTLLQTAVVKAGGAHADVAQAMLVTLWNVAMASGGLVGGLLLQSFGSPTLPWTVPVLLLPVLAVVMTARAHGFPALQRTRT
jgi:predicted MFS family arabinose efflux permease